MAASFQRLLAVISVATVAGACAPAASAAAGAPAAPHAAHERDPARGAAVGTGFVRHMIAHHEQALEMSALVDGRAGSDAVRLLAQRLAVSQADEITQMRSWLGIRGEDVADEHSHGQHDHVHHTAGHGAVASHAGMPGMATQEELAQLAAAMGAAFDRLFLELMIRHHEGALVMVDELFATAAPAQDSELYRIAAEIDAEQRMEIGRMRSMLNVLQLR